MRPKPFSIIHLSFIVIILLLSVLLFGCEEQVKEPSVSGSFYPSDENTLKDMVDAFLYRAENRPVAGKLIALISPHAGYQFSGSVAAHAYRHLNQEINTVILIGPSHYKAFKGISIYAKGRMKTPLGEIKIDERIARSLINEKADIGFYPDAFAQEHSIEVQLPFLQRALKDFKIVPILIGSPTKGSFESLTGNLIDILRKKDKAIIIASTDLSHYHDYETAMIMDKKMVDAVERISIDDIERYSITGEGEMCGVYPVIFTMAVARGLGANHGVLYKYSNSGDVTNDRGRVVGYAAIGLYKSELTKEDRDLLLKLAREAIVNYVIHRKIIEVDVTNPMLKANGSTFVTINRNGYLRGCIGNIYPFMPLYRSVISNAVAASSKDKRFLPMSKEELKDMEIEISILSPFEPLKDIRQITIGKHGLYLLKGQNSGLLLPQVPLQNRWDRNTFLEQVSFKAGLPKDSWKDAQLYIFTAEIIK